jgi:hypothetical protein
LTEIIHEIVGTPEAHIGDVSFNGVRGSNVGLWFQGVEGPYSLTAESDILRLVAQHGGRWTGRSLIPPRRVTFRPDELRKAESRARVTANRDLIFERLVRPALRREVPIVFHGYVGEQEINRTIYGKITEALFAPGITEDVRLEQFFRVGMTFVCADPLVYGPPFDYTYPLVAGARYEVDLGHEDSYVEAHFQNLGTTAWTTGTLEIEDEISGLVFTYDPSKKSVPAGSSLVFNSYTQDAYVLNRTTGVKDRDGTLDAITSPLLLPNLTRGDDSTKGAVLVNAAIGTVNKLELHYTPIYLAI